MTVDEDITTTINRYVAREISHPMEIGDKVLLLIEGKCKRKIEDPDGDGQQIKIIGLYDLSASDDGEELLKAQRALYRTKADDANGVKPLSSYTEQAALYTDASGVVMTLEEIADFRGVDWTTDQSFVIEFAGGARGLWPAEFPGQDLAAPGGVMMVPGDASERDQVVRYLDADSGEPIDEWTDDQEAERLQLEEERAVAAEAAADAAAMAEIEGGRAELMIGEDPVFSLPARAVTEHVKTCDDQSWLARLLHAERGASKPRKSVLNAVMKKLTAMGVEVE